jgi:hypothetical protein
MKIPPKAYEKCYDEAECEETIKDYLNGMKKYGYNLTYTNT